MDCGALAFFYAQEGLGCSHPRFHLPFGMFQIFVRRTLFCALSPVPLSSGTAHAGFQLKILQSTLPCVISLRFCISSLIIKYLGDYTRKSDTDLQLKSNIYLISLWEIIHPVLRVPMMGKLRESNKLSSHFFPVFFPFFFRLNSISVGRQKETHAEG